MNEFHVSYWDCPFASYDEFEDEDGGRNPQYECTHPICENPLCELDNKWSDAKVECKLLRELIFTIGHTESYERAFRDRPEGLQKKGRTRGYPGGSVWNSYDEAFLHRSPGYSVYGIIADWNRDTEKSEGNDWNDLLVDSKLVRFSDQVAKKLNRRWNEALQS